MTNKPNLHGALKDVGMALMKAKGELDYCLWHFERGTSPSIWGDQINAKDGVVEALAKLQAIFDAVPERLQVIAEITAIEGIDEFNRRCPDDYGQVGDDCITLLATITEDV